MIKRRDFLGTAVAIGALGAADAPAHAATASSSVPDIAAFEARIAKPYKHKQVVAASRLSSGSFLHYMKNTLNAYEFSWKEGPGTTHVAVVMYGPAIAAVLNDAMWSEYKISDVLATRYTDTYPANSQPRPTNPFLVNRATIPATGKSSDPLYLSDTVTALEMRGASFFVCNNALAGLAQDFARPSTDRAAVEAIRVKLTQNFVGGAMLIPAGVAALNACQEQRFTYLTGSGA